MKHVAFLFGIIVLGTVTLSANAVLAASANGSGVISVSTETSQKTEKKVSFFQKVKTYLQAWKDLFRLPPSKGLLIVLAILIPWLAVGLATDWDLKHVVINLLLGIFTCIGGIIHAIIIVNKYAS
ncbi:MAG: YqaE/Pmp3 family membrane protein [Bacteroidia bacterium]|nr:YqaE/Pmp3 family membrane protein [Bacteroidia bacterium]